MSIQIFYHITCLGSWFDIVKTQIDRIIFSGLYDEIDIMRCYIVGCGNREEVEKCIKLLGTFGKKIVIQMVNVDDKLYENFTLNDIRHHVDNNTKFLYLHTKGVTRFGTTTMKIGDTVHTIPNLYNNIMNWNSAMEYFLVKNYKQCLAELDNYDVVGINYWHLPKPHFSGNFWWARGSYFLSMSVELIESTCAECLICAGGPKFKEIFCTGLTGYPSYFHEYPMARYVDK